MRAIKRILKALLLFDLMVAAAALVAKYTLKPFGGPGDGEFRLVAIFDGVDFRSTTTALDKGDAIAMFGGIQLDLRRALTGPTDARLEVTAIFGGVEVVVPDTWAVEVAGPAIAGGIDARVPDPTTLPADAPHLRVQARAVFGGIQVVARPVVKAAEG